MFIVDVTIVSLRFFDAMKIINLVITIVVIAFTRSTSEDASFRRYRAQKTSKILFHLLICNKQAL